MKRNEAIQKLRVFLFDRKVSSVDTLGALSHSIIKFIEDELGMLPPLPPDALKYEEIIPGDYIWEPEDEK